MADLSARAGARRARALGLVDEWLSTSAHGARKLTNRELGFYSSHLISGWRIPIALANSTQEIDLLISNRFPWGPPQVALPPPSKFLIIPHVESNGRLCLLSGEAETDPARPLEVVKNLLHETVKLLEKAASGNLDDEFRNEFTSYWVSDDAAPNIRSLINPIGPSRPLKIWYGTSFYLVGEVASDIIRWLNHLNPELRASESDVEDAALIWLRHALVPSEFPCTAKDLFQIAKNSFDDGPSVLEECITTSERKKVVIIGADTKNGPALAAVTIQRPRINKGTKTREVEFISQGFRPNRVPKYILVDRMFGGAKLLRSSVIRIDSPWVHGRGKDHRQRALTQSTVCIIGCGSVGSQVTAMLARAGVGRLILADPEPLMSANVGRHYLGMESIHHYKADELAARLRKDFPHIREIVVKHQAWEDIANGPELLSSCDLIISTVGSWSTEGALNEWHLASGRILPVIYGWTEPHACAGHAVLVSHDGGCLACGLSTFGEPQLAVASWAATTHLQEPACGGVYQPYGPIELGQIISTISELALDTILQSLNHSAHRVWCARRSHVEASGGKWTAAWELVAKNRVEGGFLEALPWERSAHCKFCST